MFDSWHDYATQAGANTTEAMCLLGRAGSQGQRALWRLVETGRLGIGELTEDPVRRSARLMDKYADTPMDLADATLVAYAEEHGHRRIFTIDSDLAVTPAPPGHNCRRVGFFLRGSHRAAELSTR